MFLGSLRGLRVQILLWTVLPITLMLVAVSVWGINTHQAAMRDLVAAMDARAAKLAAGHLSDELSNRLVLLDTLAESEALPDLNSISPLFDGGLAQLAPDGSLLSAAPSPEIWDTRPINNLHAGQSVLSIDHVRQALYSPLFVDAATGREMLLIGLAEDDGRTVVGAVSLDRLGEPGVVQLTVARSELPRTDGGQSLAVLISFLVDRQGTVIFHPDPTQIGQDYRTHEGVSAVTKGLSGATVHFDDSGQEMVAGYAPVDGPGWGLVMQEPWETLIAPNFRLSLLTPLLVIIVALVSGVAVTFGLRYIVHPLQALDTKATGFMGDGPVAFTAAETMLGTSSDVLYGKIQRGGMGTGMPGFGPVFTREQSAQMVNYLRTFVFDLQ